MMKKIPVLFIMMLVLAGCTTSQKATTVGGLTGATIGGIIGHQSGDGVKGAAIGGVVGTVGGMLIGNHLEKKFCPECGAVYRESEAYCPIDGTELKYRQR